MNDQITQLVILQAIDQEIDQIDTEVKTEQEELNKRISTLADKETYIGELLEKITGLEQDRRTLEDEMTDKVAHVKERQSKMMQVQTGREQTALLKEIEDAKKSAKENEEKILAILEEVETLTATMQEEKNLLKGEKELLTDETEKVRTTIESINKGKKSKDKSREAQSQNIKKSLLSKYNTLRKRRKGLAVVNVKQGVCQGCYMTIPPQKYNMLLKGDTFFDCPTCQRIMYYAEEEAA